MQIEIDPTTMLRGLGYAGLVKNGSAPEISIAAADERIAFYGFTRSPQALIAAMFDCRVARPGAVMIPADRLKTVATAAKKKGDIKIGLDNGDLVLRVGRAKQTLVTEAVIESPETYARQYGSTDVTLKFDSPAPLKAMISRIMRPLNTGDDADSFSGLLQLKIEEDCVRGYTTDGRRLAESCYRKSFGVAPAVVHIPGSAVTVFHKVMQSIKEDYEVFLSFGSNQIVFEYGDVRYTTGVSTKSLPRVEQVLTLADPFYKAQLDADEFRTNLQILGTTAEETMALPYVDLKFVNGELRLNTRGAGKGDSKAQMFCDYEGPEILSRFSIPYLIDALSGAEQVSFCVKPHKDNNPQTPWHAIILHDDDPFKTRHVVMPMIVR